MVSEYRKGHLSRLDICDAHPELLRAAADAGEDSPEDCPICEDVKLRLVSYVFGHRPPALGPLRRVEKGAGQTGRAGQGPGLLRDRGLSRVLVEPPGSSVFPDDKRSG